MKVIIFGAPGSGKGTQSVLLSNRKLFFRLSPGDLLRLELTKNTNLSNKIKLFIQNGNLINDEIIFNLISKNLNRENILFDGYPRNLNQALFLNSKGIKIDLIINIDVSFLSIYKRIKYRMISKNSDIILSLLSKNLDCIRYKNNDSGLNFFKRLDDTYNIIYKRLIEYSNENSKLIKYYFDSGIFILNLDGNQDVNSVYISIEKCINKFYKKNG
ncbi:MAG TPA: adenylate kinase family protein [Candidatus Azoamicus sp.]